MAEDKVASLRTEVSESEKKLAEKMQGLKRKLIVDEIFVRTRRLPTKIILGPCFKNMFTTELSPHYPLAEGEKLLLHSAEPDWFKDKTLRSWPNVSGMWIDWVDRVEKAKWEVWKSADIYDAIQLSKHDIPLDKNLLYGALCYWSISTNSFHFRFGMMGPTVLDIVALTGLRPHGEDVSVPLGVAKLARDLPEYTKIKECLTYCKFLDVSMGAMAVTEEEHISFLVMWLCRYLFCNSSITMIEQCTKLALALSKGRKLALAPFVLSNLYHACTDIVTGGFDDARGPFWILQLWLQAYFPEHQPSTLDDGSPLTYGHALVDGVLRPKTFSQYVLFFNKCSSRTASQFTPFSSRKFGPEWFKRSLDPYFQKLNRTELKDIWASYLIARDLPYSICMDESSKCKCMVEHYSPNQFARQFGMTQAIPFYQSANDSISKENFRDDSEETESRFSQLKREFSFVPFNVNPSSTDFFDFWWSTYMNNRDKTTTATDVLRKISLYVTPLGSSEKQEVAAHRSNGIKGNSQSAGKFVRNMKRKYEGYSIPSRSFVQQNDESGQQKNSYEVAEKISIKSTICKKMKTSAMKMPLLRTTSSVPFASAFLTSRASADEDETKADEQVSDANDTSTSALSSTSEKEGEKCTVSPSLAETESKASDVSEPPDCPVKFDNLEDFFARVSGQIKQAQSLGFSADHSSPIDENTSAMQKSTPSAEMLATAKEDIERLLIMPSQDLLQPENCSKLTAALSVYIASSDLSVERALAFEKLKENLPHLSSTYHRAKKDREDYYKKAAKKVILIDELTKGQEHYANLKDYSDKLECTTDSIRNQIRKLKASLKDAKTKRKAIQDQKLSLAKKCFEKSNALDEMEAESPEMKEIADSDIARVEEILTELKSKIKSNRVCKSLFHVNLLSSDP